MSERIFSNEELDRILRRAINRSADYKGGVTESELHKIASELNISPESVKSAIDEDRELAGYEEAKSMYIAKKRRSFSEHLAAYLIVNGFLFGLNLLTLGYVSWAWFPILGWGIGLAFDFFETYHPDPAKVDAGARKLMKSNKWKNLVENLGFKFLEGLQKK
jgi:hypothetical protein